MTVPLLVDGPAVVQPRYGLFSTALFPTPEGSKWQFGVKWEAEAACAEQVGGYPFTCEVRGAGEPLLEFRGGQEVPEAEPFILYGTYDCKTMSKPLAESEARAREHLLLWEERGVERAIMHGDLGNSPSFQGATVLDADPVSAAQGINLLEEWAALNIPGTPVLHFPRSLTGTVNNWWVQRQGEHLETMVGSMVAMGGGYDMPNVSPAGAAHAEDARWAYVTSRPVIRRSEVFVTPQESNRVDIGDNGVRIAAHRVYVVGWDCGAAAVQINQE